MAATICQASPMTRTERLLRLARQRGDRAAELILRHPVQVDNRLTRIPPCRCDEYTPTLKWTEAELRAAWGDR